MPNERVTLGLRMNAALRMHALNLSSAIKTLIMQANAIDQAAVEQVLLGGRVLTIEVAPEPGFGGHLRAILTIHTGARLPRDWEPPVIRQRDRVVYVNQHGSAVFGTVVGPHYMKEWDGSWDVVLGRAHQPVALHPRDLMKVEPYAPDAA